MKQLYILLFLFPCMYSCAQKSMIETDIVKENKLHLEQITDTTHIIRFLGKVPYTYSYDDIIVSDNRLFVFNNIPLRRLIIEMKGKVPTLLKMEILKKTVEEDIKELKKYLTSKYGTPEISEYDEKEIIWKDIKNNVSFQLKQYEPDYYDYSSLRIYFWNNR